MLVIESLYLYLNCLIFSDLLDFLPEKWVMMFIHYHRERRKRQEQLRFCILAVAAAAVSLAESAAATAAVTSMKTSMVPFLPFFLRAFLPGGLAFWGPLRGNAGVGPWWSPLPCSSQVQTLNLEAE